MTLGRDSTIVYNRVPKCGSRTVQDIIKLMSQEMNFTYTESMMYSRFNVAGEEAVGILIAMIEKKT